ncbi:hypothetical protein EOA60_17160 [Mesorhizobium sp. M1A.F.Ca.IN.020.06.1.1]|uniref:hypothetical protein n=1 Tax=unclassified Mesorhizobium TaxID=325217 RepID=UPI000FCB2BAF|nr:MULTISPECIES: hypothetical protein [unclassified Mesorhizobium]RUV81443.1 hypothetical protein EOA51_31245 [Mesorhizobium sp. M1A.F.Ca.IN.020.32.1.1]RUW04229.1 hypothetical protein EOA46_31480 [Mesorhizobium sp. M1A.F.Ca.IN.022.05.2.1]RUW28684.1 hypothetical protein EOA60_17160 [Mesorhizobium sp. M1A.F.Ca.IN.020.06.1.1]RWF85032.1 MAG: hypothetical protein EOQ35_00440 [Mesorhizobium sp.]RWF93878.1 MAG: hypothetical protein EOQ38_28030 [Mesorhizobium sp.]
MVVGDPSYWAGLFISIDDRLLDRIVAVWPRCLALLPPNPEEDVITTNLVYALSRDVEARKLFHWLEYQYEPFGFTTDGLAFSKGQIDMAVLLDRERDRYLAYECKRLNVLYRGARQSLATRYVGEGLKRFTTEQYAEGLSVGCMLGYVLDGDCEFAMGRVQAAIDGHKVAVGLSGPPVAVGAVGDIQRFATRHVRPASGQEIEIRHALIPFPAAAFNSI